MMVIAVRLQVADEDDRIDDPSVSWPDIRKQIELGRLAIGRPSQIITRRRRSYSSRLELWFLGLRQPIP
jgi:hypothetical protein